MTRPLTQTPADEPLLLAEPDGAGPLRRSVASRARLPKEGMIRFVVSPEGVLTPDFAARLPGRGMWVEAEATKLAQAIRSGAFARNARLAPGERLVIPPDLPERVRTGLKARLIETLGLARRAGAAVAGFEKVREWLAEGRVGLLVQAGDGSSEEKARLRSGYADVPIIAPLSAAELGRIFGRERVVHAAVAHGSLAARLMQDNARLAGFMPPPEPEARDESGTRSGIERGR
jgi:predicted RNA-binding protein YlxR (DUF448 family)/ribosomal protein L7Ae-like RNA K-turn-binding protein